MKKYTFYSDFIGWKDKVILPLLIKSIRDPKLLPLIDIGGFAPPFFCELDCLGWLCDPTAARCCWMFLGNPGGELTIKPWTVVIWESSMPRSWNSWSHRLQGRVGTALGTIGVFRGSIPWVRRMWSWRASFLRNSLPQIRHVWFLSPVWSTSCLVKCSYVKVI